MSKKQLFSKPVRKQTMADQMAETVQEAILSGELEPGAVLPTEPDLAGQFGVSRAVVRDATRLLMARGLVEVQHGRGVFVTSPENEAFGQALLLTLRRTGASAWDVEQFGQIMFPEFAALAASKITEDEITHIRQLGEAYIDRFAIYQARWLGKQAPIAEREDLADMYRQVLRAILDATHNTLVQQLAQPLLQLRNLRTWADDPGTTPEQLVASEAYHVRRFVEAIAGRDPDQARATVSRLLALPPEAVDALHQTPVGEVAVIPLPQPAPDGDETGAYGQNR